MTPTDEPGRNGPRLRARAKTGAPDALRPEVASALGGLERSIGELTEWEHLLAGAPGDEAAGGAVAPPSAADLVLLAHVTPGPDEPAEQGPAGQTGLDLGLPTAALGGAVASEPFVEPNLDLSPLFTHEGDGPDGVGPIPETIVPSATYGPGPDPRRRRNGRILSWAGAIILVAVAAFWLLPSRGGSNNPTTRDTTTTTPEPTTTRVTLGGATFPTLPTTTLPATPSVTAPAVIPTTPTTAKKAKAKVTTTTPTTAAPTTTAAPVTTTTVRPTTTTTLPPTTTTTCAPGGEPDPEHGTC